MKCRILKPLKANDGRELNPGDVVDVPKDVAIKYIEKGKIKPIEKAAYRIYSNILQGYLWIVDTDRDLHSLRDQGITEAVYTRQEIGELQKLPKEVLKDIHKIKEVFDKSVIEEVRTRKERK